MRFGKIELPKELLKAQVEGKLVFFAGAGVSVPPPSSLPNFEDLVKNIAAETKYKDKIDHEPLDRILGDMEREGVEIKKLSYEILSTPSSKPTDLHQTILHLSKCSGSEVRLVTTNLDSHFSMASHKLFDNIDEFYAPALPLGSSFNGIVYLHGSVLKSPEQFVLTDGDFGKAYLIDGWSTKFIKEMFLHYTVLFVGYSHNDTVMNYLSRGLPPAALRQRFVLTDKNDSRHWERLGITPIVYPLDIGKNKHLALNEGLAAWYHHISMGLLDHETRIREIVSRRPPIDQEDIDYILDRIENNDSIQFFIRHANHPEWVFWVHEQGLLKELFDPNANPGPISNQLAFWLAKNFVRQYPYSLLQIIEKNGQNLNQVLWNNIILALYRESDDIIDRKVFNIWVNLLLKRTYDVAGGNLVGFLLSGCKLPEDQESAIALISYLTKPALKLEQKSYLPEEERDVPSKNLDADVELAGHSYFLRDGWNKIFRRNLGIVGDRIFTIFKEHIETAYDLLEPFKTNPGKFDSLSYRRAAVERHNQNHRLNDGFPMLLDAYSDVLEWIASERLDITQAVIRWIESRKHLFKRFAIFTMTKSKFYKPKQKIRWLLEHDLIYDYDTHHEVYGLIKEVYPMAKEEDKRNILRSIVDGPNGDDEKELKWEQYQVYRTLEWLKRYDPACKLLIAEFNRVRKANPDYEPHEHPDFHSYTSGGWVHKSESPYEVSELLSLDLEENIEQLLIWQPKGRFSRSRSGLLSAVEDAIIQNSAWGLSLGNALAKRAAWDTDLWNSIISGWSKAKLSDAEWQSVLSYLLEHKELFRHSYHMSNLLHSGIEKKETSIPKSCFNLAMELAEALWDAGRSQERNRDEVKDWFSTSINHHAGKLSEFWLHILSRMCADSKTKEFPRRIRAQLEKIIDEKSYQAELGRVLIASQILFLFSLSEEWTAKKVIPLFDVESDSLASTQAWDGYLPWGRWSDELLVYLRPMFQKIFKKMALLGDDRERFFKYVSEICLYAANDPQESNWLFDFLMAATDEDRGRFAQVLELQFGKMKANVRSEVWKKWIKEYWISRNNGKPLKFSEAEKISMIWMSIRLSDQEYVGAVKLVEATEAPTIKRPSLYHTLKKEQIANKNPVPTLKLLLHLLPVQKKDFFYSCKDLEAIADILVGKLGIERGYRTDLAKLCDLLAKLGCPKAAEIRAKIPTDR